MLLKLYKLLFKITRNRKWLLAYIDEMDKQIRNEINEFRKEE